MDLGHHEPYDAPGLFAFLAARVVAGVESVDLPEAGLPEAELPEASGASPSSGGPTAQPLRYSRSLRLPDGPGAFEVTASREGAAWRLHVTVEAATPADVDAAVVAVRRLLDLEHDPSDCDAELARDPLLRGSVRQTPGIRAPGSVDAHEVLVRAIVGQQISVVAARGHLTRLASVAGSPSRSSFDGVDRLFPIAEQIADALPEPVAGAAPDPERPLRLPARGVAAVLSAARDLASGALVLEPAMNPAALWDSLVARPSIGPWTAGYVAMRVLGEPDVWLPSDVALVAGGRALGMVPDGLTKAGAQRELAARSTRWAPWRTYAAMHLWRAAARP